MLGIATVTIIMRRSLFAVVMLFGIYSLLSASLFVVLDAVDVAFTEAAVGAGISTMLMLATLVITGHKTKGATKTHKPWLPLLVVTLTGAVLIWGTMDMPQFADPNAPVHQHVAPRYIQESPVEIDIPNMVTSVLASYRGYDTMGEVIVVFAALVGVLTLLGIKSPRPAKPEDKQAPLPILQVITVIIVPFILLFALYVQFHGEYGPGGGFQAGVIFASAIVLYTMTFGLNDALRLTPPKVMQALAAGGVLLYGGTGIVTMLLGGNFLDYNALDQHDPVHGQHLGILFIEFGVGLTVASVMMLIFFAFVSRGERD